MKCKENPADLCLVLVKFLIQKKPEPNSMETLRSFIL